MARKIYICGMGWAYCDGKCNSCSWANTTTTTKTETICKTIEKQYGVNV